MMTPQEQAQITQDLQSKIWAAANALRQSGMEANDYRDYTLGLIFYKYESDRFLKKITEGLGVEFTNLDDAQATYESALLDEDAKGVVDFVKSELRFAIDSDKTFHHLVQDVRRNIFQLDDLAQALQDLEDSDEVFSGLFDALDLNADKLATTEQERNSIIGDVMSALDQIYFVEDTGMDIMGNAYEYLISQFQTESAKKAGEFYTPQAVSRLMMQIAMEGREEVQGVSIYDPAMGSGSLLLNAKHYNSHPDSIQYFGQDNKTAPYNLSRMNMMLHDVPTANQHLNLGNTLGSDWPSEEPTTFDIVTMNHLTVCHGSQPLQWLQILGSSHMMSHRNQQRITLSLPMACITLKLAGPWPSYWQPAFCSVVGLKAESGRRSYPKATSQR